MKPELKISGIVLNEVYLASLIQNACLDHSKHEILKKSIIRCFDSYVNFVHFLLTECSTSISNNTDHRSVQCLLDAFNLTPDNVYELDIYSSMFSASGYEPYSVFNMYFYDVIVNDMYTVYASLFKEDIDSVMEEFVFLMEDLYRKIENDMFYKIYQSEVINEDVKLIINIVNPCNIIIISVIDPTGFTVEMTY